MTILTTSTSNQTFVLTLKRESVSDLPNKFDLTDKETNITTTHNIISNVPYDYYDSIQVNVALLEGHTYRIKVYKDTLDDVRYVGLVFCTDQVTTPGYLDVEGYTVNNSVYTEKTTTNEFTILE